MKRTRDVQDKHEENRKLHEITALSDVGDITHRLANRRVTQRRPSMRYVKPPRGARTPTG